MHRLSSSILFLAVVACNDGNSGSDAGDDTSADTGGRGDDTDASNGGGDDTGEETDTEREPCPVGPYPACDDTDDEVYGYSVADAEAECPGTVVACSPGESEVGVFAVSLFMPAGLEATSGYTADRISYRTERAPGVAGVGSAMLFRPTVPSTDPEAPVVVLPHGTTGVADNCAPSRGIGGDPYILAPFIGTGLTVISVDYAGLGTEGVHGYGDPRDISYSVLDGARAALSAAGLPEDHPILIAGHSQGGAAALGAQALAATYAPELTINGVISWAGGIISSETGFDIDPALVELLPLFPISDAIGSTRAILALNFYADFALLFGEERAGDVFAENIRDVVVQSVENECVFDIAATLMTATADYTPPQNLGDFIAPDVLDGVMACVSGDQAGCTPTAETWIARLEANSQPLPDGDGAPILYISGDQDTLHLPAYFGCNLDIMEDRGVQVEACLESGLTHFDIIIKTAGPARSWAGGAPFVCQNPVTPPACQQ